MTNCARRVGEKIAAAVLVALLAGGERGMAQMSGISSSLADSPGAMQARTATGTQPALHIVILEGEDTLNNIRERVAREPIVQVEDDNHKPVAGVVIVFFANTGNGGAGATFGGASSFTTVTDSAGRAVGKGFTPNLNGGKYTISVRATVAGTVVAEAVIHAGNAAAPALGSSAAAAPKGGTAAKIPGHGTVKWVLVGSGVGAGIIIATLLAGGNNAAHISTGTGTVVP